VAKEDFSLSIGDMAKAVAEGLKDLSRAPNLITYKPHPKQLRFHKSRAKGRLYVGGNRSGKTLGGTAEAIYYMKGEHPFKPVPAPPTKGRIVTVDFKKGEQEIIIPKLQQMIPKSLLKNGSWEDSYNSRYHKLTLTNNSTAEIMSHEQDLEAFAGTDRDWLWMDEECPKPIFKECRARLVDRDGDWWMTETPIDGMTWVYDEIFIKYIDRPSDRYEVIVVDIADNPHIPTESRLEFLLGLSDEERKIRGQGAFVPLGGLLLREFSYDDNVIEHIDPPLEWEWWVTIDPGFRNPTAVLWHAVSPTGSVYTFHEHYRSEWIVANHAAYIKKYNAKLGKEPEKYVGDLAMNQRQQATGLSIQQEYRNHGISCILAKKGKGSVEAGIDKMNEYFQHGKWQISDTCVNLIKEIRKYRGKPYASAKLEDANNKREQPQAKDDHAIDSSRYLFTFLPKLDRPSPYVDKIELKNAAVAAMMDVRNVRDMSRIKVYPWQWDRGTVTVPGPDLGYGEIP
jgi:hypothetical protein